MLTFQVLFKSLTQPPLTASATSPRCGAPSISNRSNKTTSADRKFDEDISVGYLCKIEFIVPAFNPLCCIGIAIATNIYRILRCTLAIYFSPERFATNFCINKFTLR